MVVSVKEDSGVRYGSLLWGRDWVKISSIVVMKLCQLEGESNQKKVKMFLVLFKIVGAVINTSIDEMKRQFLMFRLAYSPA